MASNASNSFSTLSQNVTQLLKIHTQLQQGPGRRHEQGAIHRAGVVLTVAAWDAYIEQIVIDAFDSIMAHANTSSPPPHIHTTLTLLQHEATSKARQLNTPNAENVKRLFLNTLGLNPWLSWHWRVRRRQWDEQEMRSRLNDWIKIRHTVAHGSALPTHIQWIQDDNGHPRLIRTHLEECLRFFERLIAQTDAAVSQHLQATYTMPAPW